MPNYAISECSSIAVVSILLNTPHFKCKYPDFDILKQIYAVMAGSIVDSFVC